MLKIEEKYRPASGSSPSMLKRRRPCALWGPSPLLYPSCLLHSISALSGAGSVSLICMTAMRREADPFGAARLRSEGACLDRSSVLLIVQVTDTYTRMISSCPETYLEALWKFELMSQCNSVIQPLSRLQIHRLQVSMSAGPLGSAPIRCYLITQTTLAVRACSGQDSPVSLEKTESGDGIRLYTYLYRPSCPMPTNA